MVGIDASLDWLASSLIGSASLVGSLGISCFYWFGLADSAGWLGCSASSMVSAGLACSVGSFVLILERLAGLFVDGLPRLYHWLVCVNLFGSFSWLIPQFASQLLHWLVRLACWLMSWFVCATGFSWSARLAHSAA